MHFHSFPVNLYCTVWEPLEIDLWYEFLPSSECLARGRCCGAGARSTRLKQGAVARNGETALVELKALGRDKPQDELSPKSRSRARGGLQDLFLQRRDTHFNRCPGLQLASLRSSSPPCKNKHRTMPSASLR